MNGDNLNCTSNPLSCNFFIAFILSLGTDAFSYVFDNSSSVVVTVTYMCARSLSIISIYSSSPIIADFVTIRYGILYLFSNLIVL